MSDQLFWILSIFLLVELMSQIFQFEIFGKIYMQFYTIVIHALVGISLASFETRELVYYFLILIAFVNSFRYLTYKIPIMQKNSLFRFSFDIIMILIMLTLLTVIQQYIQFQQVPVISTISQIAFISAISLTLIYEMIQRATGTGLRLIHFFPGSILSFSLVVGAILTGIYLVISPFIGFSFALRVQILLGFIIFSILIRVITLKFSKNDEFYDLFYITPSLFVVIVFVQLVLMGV